MSVTLGKGPPPQPLICGQEVEGNEDLEDSHENKGPGSLVVSQCLVLPFPSFRPP